MAYAESAIKKVRIISIIHIIISVLCFIVGIVQVAEVHHWSSYIGYGLWGGIWFFLTGLLGYFSARPNGNNQNCCSNNCLIGLFMAFAIIGTVLAGIFVIIYGMAVSEFNVCVRCHDNPIVYDRYHHHDEVTTCGYMSWYHKYSSRSECMTGKGLLAFVLALQLFEFCLTIASAVFCCSGVCCQHRPPPQVIFMPATGGMVQVQGGAIIGGQPGQVAYIQQGQTPMVMSTTTTQIQGAYPQQTPQVYQPQAFQQAPPPAYDGSMAAGVTAPDQNAGPLPQKI